MSVLEKCDCCGDTREQAPGEDLGYSIAGRRSWRAALKIGHRVYDLCDPCHSDMCVVIEQKFESYRAGVDPGETP